MTEHKYTKYLPPECQYPVFQAFDYCWGLASSVDEGRGDEFIKGCYECEYYEPIINKEDKC